MSASIFNAFFQAWPSASEVLPYKLYVLPATEDEGKPDVFFFKAYLLGSYPVAKFASKARNDVPEHLAPLLAC
jgi:hypothetical protein